MRNYGYHHLTVCKHLVEPNCNSWQNTFETYSGHTLDEQLLERICA